jgi:hypothetical protein
MRDDFNKPTKELLAKRVGYVCSNPECRKHTIGANSDPNKTTSIGVAAHITAAAVGGPRYSSLMKEDQRKDASNGIWLCQSCSRLIDVDPKRFSVELLNDWKLNAESESIEKLISAVAGIPVVNRIPKIEAELKITSRTRRPQGPAREHFEKYGDKAVFSSQAIIRSLMEWDYNIELLNNSSYNAFYIKLYFPKDIHPFSKIEKIGVLKNLPALKTIKIQASQKCGFVGTGEEAMAFLHTSIFPNPSTSLEFVVEYHDEENRKYFMLCQFNGEEIVNQPIKELPLNYMNT